MMQIQADLLNARVNRPKCVESTALGAACLAGLAVGVFRDLADIAAHWQSERVFTPQMSEPERAERPPRLAGARFPRAMDWEER